MYIDAHAHLCDDKLFGDAAKIVADAESVGVKRIVDSGNDRATSERAYGNAQKYGNVYCAVGIHPEEADKASQGDYGRFSEMYGNPKTVAIGEIGLDYHFPANPPKDVQKRVFCEQIELADALNAPMVLHIRDATGDAYGVLDENKSKLHGVLLHCYGGSKESVREFNRFDAYYSFGGAVTFKNAKNKAEVIKSVPADRLLLETDCPYMSPEPFRGRVNSPENIIYTAKKIAEIIGVSMEELQEITTRNAFDFFKKMK
jgi:TatD DNase family protein